MLTVLILVFLSVLSTRDAASSVLLTLNVLTLTPPTEVLNGEELMPLVPSATSTLTLVFLLPQLLVVFMMLIATPLLVNPLVPLLRVFVWNVSSILTALDLPLLVMLADKLVLPVLPMSTAKVVRTVLKRFALSPLPALW